MPLIPRLPSLFPFPLHLFLLIIHFSTSGIFPALCLTLIPANIFILFSSSFLLISSSLCSISLYFSSTSIPTPLPFLIYALLPSPCIPFSPLLALHYLMLDCRFLFPFPSLSPCFHSTLSKSLIYFPSASQSASPACRYALCRYLHAHTSSPDTTILHILCLTPYTTLPTLHDSVLDRR